LKKYVFIIVLLIIAGVFFFINPSLPNNYGIVETRLFLGDKPKQPLIVGFGGSEGGNHMASDKMKSIRDSFIQNGYAFLAVAYFGTAETPELLDRISLNAIYDSIMRVAQHPLINKERIILYGGSRGAELVLNLASRYNNLAAVIAMVPPHVSLPSKFGWRATASWTYKNEDIPYVKASGKSMQLIWDGDFYAGFVELLKDEKLINGAEIEVEKINCPVLIMSAKNDEVWPSEYMAGKIMDRLKSNNFSYHYEHISFDGGHGEPSNHTDTIFSFLNTHLSNK